MKLETREHVLTIETIIYSEYQNEKSPCLDFIGGEATQSDCRMSRVQDVTYAKARVSDIKPGEI